MCVLMCCLFPLCVLPGAHRSRRLRRAPLPWRLCICRHQGLCGFSCAECHLRTAGEQEHEVGHVHCVWWHDQRWQLAVRRATGIQVRYKIRLDACRMLHRLAHPNAASTRRGKRFQWIRGASKHVSARCLVVLCCVTSSYSLRFSPG